MGGVGHNNSLCPFQRLFKQTRVFMSIPKEATTKMQSSQSYSGKTFVFIVSLWFFQQTHLSI